MRINMTSVLVDDQAKALEFYTEVLGFVKKKDIPAGEASFLTVVSADAPDDIELLLEPDWNPDIKIHGRPAAQVYKKTLFEAGIPATSFAVDDVQREYERLRKLGVAFASEPTAMGPITSAVFNDTCGNLIMIAAPHDGQESHDE